MIQNANNLLCEDLNPTFLFTWKGTRKSDEKSCHSHDYMEIVFIMYGEGKYKIENDIYSIREGDLIILSSGIMHQALIDDQGIPTVEFFVGAGDIQLRGMERNHLDLKGGGYILHTSGDLKLKISKICASIQAENDVPKAGCYFMLKAYLIQLLLLIIREQEEPVVLKSRYEFESRSKKYIVEKIIDYFEDHYGEKISLDQIAENMYLSPFYISKIFKTETGDTPIRHLINIRLEKAREILTTEEDISIQEVAARVGYDDAYHFSKLYKKRFGVSPSKTKKVK